MNLISDHDDSANHIRYRSALGTLLTSQIAETDREDDPSSTENDLSRFLSGESSEFRRGGAGGEKEEFRSMMYGATLGTAGNGTALGGCLGVGVDAGSVRTNDGILFRNSSSPAGLFTHLTADNVGLSTMKNVDRFRTGSASHCDKSMTSRMKQQSSFPSLASSNRSLSRIPELGGESSAASGSDGGGSFLNGFPIGSWDDSHLMPESYSHLHNSDHPLGRKLDGTRIPAFAASHSQNGESLSRGPGLSHQFSLPKTSSEMAAVEKFFGQMHDTVPCRVRAKRGCATHPRSIAERVRRTRISERMRKLQELVPNMDKQTNTAVMLELAVDYIKDLRQKVQELSDSRSRCTCAAPNNVPISSRTPQN